MTINRIDFQGMECIIRERKKQVENKPKFYIWSLSNFQYISSLYNTDNENIKKFDFKGKLYELNFETMEYKQVA